MHNTHKAGIDTIVFDYGAVIFQIDHSLTVNAFRDLGISGDDAFFGHLQQNPLFDQFEMGLISPDNFRDSIRKILAKELDDESIDAAWNKMLLGLPGKNLEVLLACKQRYRTFLLSNNNEIHYNWIDQYLQNTYGIQGMMRDYFEKDYYSHLMGMRKPNKDIFEFIIHEQQINPAHTLFIDDSPQHLATAEILGFQTRLMKKEDILSEVIAGING